MRGQHQHLVAGAQQRLERQLQAMRPAHRDHDVVRLAGDAILVRQLLDQRVAQRMQAAGIGVVRLSRARRGGQRLDDVRRRIEVRLAALQVQHGFAPQLACARIRHHLRQLGAGAQDGAVAHETRHRTPPWMAPISRTRGADLERALSHNGHEAEVGGLAPPESSRAACRLPNSP